MEPLDRLTLLRSQIDALEAELRSCVAESRAGGASWSTIGERLGVTMQAAHRRFRERPADIENAPLSDPLFDALFHRTKE